MIYLSGKADKKDLLDHVRQLLIAWLWRHIQPAQREGIIAYLDLMKSQTQVMQHSCEFTTSSSKIGFRLTIEVSFDHEQALSNRRAVPNPDQRQGNG